jgi:hypothetical protein
MFLDRPPAKQRRGYERKKYESRDDSGARGENEPPAAFARFHSSDKRLLMR